MKKLYGHSWGYAENETKRGKINSFKGEIWQNQKRPIIPEG